MPAIWAHHHLRPAPATPLRSLDVARLDPTRIIMTTYTAASVPAVAFVASADFVEALDLAAGQAGLTRSHYARDVIAKHLRDIGALPSEAALTRAAKKRKLLAEKRDRLAARARV